MIKVRIVSQYMGRCAIRDKYVKEALDKKEDLIIEYNNKLMLIPFNKIKKSIIGKSEKPYPDYFSNKWHFLLYFKWKPKIIQKILL